MDEKSGSDSTVQRSAYRQPVTAKGLKAIEDGTLTWLDDEMYNNLNTGVLEQYLEEKNLDESFEVSHWSPSKVMIGIAIGVSSIVPATFLSAYFLKKSRNPVFAILAILAGLLTCVAMTGINL